MRLDPDGDKRGHCAKFKEDVVVDGRDELRNPPPPCGEYKRGRPKKGDK